MESKIIATELASTLEITVQELTTALTRIRVQEILNDHDPESILMEDVSNGMPTPTKVGCQQWLDAFNSYTESEIIELIKENGDA